MTRRLSADMFPTPRWATWALLAREEFSGEIWEPACGNGAISEVLAAAGHSITSSDLYDYGYGESGVDFLTSSRSSPNIITNPPYNQAEAFVRAALPRAAKTAFLLRLAFLEGEKRAASLFTDHPPSRIWVFPSRVTFYPLGEKTAGTGTTAYAWFIWDGSEGTQLGWLPRRGTTPGEQEDPFR